MQAATNNLQSVRDQAKSEDFLCEVNALSYDILFVHESWRDAHEEMCKTTRGDNVFFRRGGRPGQDGLQRHRAKAGGLQSCRGWAQGSLGHGHLHRDGQQPQPRNRVKVRRKSRAWSFQRPPTSLPRTSMRWGAGPRSSEYAACFRRSAWRSEAPSNVAALARQGRYHGGIAAKGTTPARGPVDHQVQAALVFFSGGSRGQVVGICMSKTWQTQHFLLCLFASGLFATLLQRDQKICFCGGIPSHKLGFR